MNRVDEYIADTKSVINEISDASSIQNTTNVIDINVIQTRENAIEQLIKIKRFLNEAIAVIDNKTAAARSLQNADVKKIDQFMSSFKSNTSWKNKLMMGVDAATGTTMATTMATPPQQLTPTPPTPSPTSSNVLPIVAPTSVPTSSPTSVPTSSPTAPPGLSRNDARLSSPKQSISITSNIHLDAVPIPHISEVKFAGVLYYIPSMDHFAIRLGRHVLHGNIGNIYHNRRDPERVKTCKFGGNCNKLDSCTYYHDPEMYPGRKDIRNYTANSWLYVEQSATNRDPSKIRRFGSRDNMDIDLANITEDEIERFSHQLFHDMLCLLVLMECDRKNM